MAATDKFYDARVTVWVFCPTDEFPLKYPDLIVYSYMAGAAKLGRTPSGNQIEKNTGISRNTVTQILRRLEDVGLLVGGEPRPKPEWFRSRRSRPGAHWADGFQFWPCLVRSDDEESPLLVSDATVYSYLLSRSSTGRPPARWSHAYVATALKMDEKTVAKVLERLAHLNLFRVDDDGDWCIANALTGIHDTWFRKKGVASPTATALKTFVPETAGSLPKKAVKAAAPSFDDDDLGPDLSTRKAGPVQVEIPDSHVPDDESGTVLAPSEGWVYLAPLHGLDADRDWKIHDQFGQWFKRFRATLGPNWREPLAAAFEIELKKMKGDKDVATNTSAA